MLYCNPTLDNITSVIIDDNMVKLITTHINIQIIIIIKVIDVVTERYIELAKSIVNCE